MRNILHSQEEGAGVLAFVGENLRRLRLRAGLSQAALAEASGISRRMIVALEGGDTNISLSSLDRLAAALGASFVALVSDPAAHSQRIDALAWKGRSSESCGVLLGSVPARSEAQLWVWSLAPGECYLAQPDPEGWHEMIFVTAGCLSLRLGAQTIEVAAGDYAIYSSAQDYAYSNETEQVTCFVRNVVS